MAEKSVVPNNGEVDMLLQRIRDGELAAFDALYRMVELHTNPMKALWIRDAARQALAAWKRRMEAAESLLQTLEQWDHEEIAKLTESAE